MLPLVTGISPSILKAMRRWIPLVTFVLLLTGCVEQTMTIKTDPPGALVYLNDLEVGRTPLTRDFMWYGNYDVEVRKDGYQTLKTHQWVVAPKYLWVPFDLFMELQPATVTDHHDLFFKLEPETAAMLDPGPVISRAEELKGDLESSKFTRKPTTQPTTRASTRPAVDVKAR